MAKTQSSFSIETSIISKFQREVETGERSEIIENLLQNYLNSQDLEGISDIEKEIEEKEEKADEIQKEIEGLTEKLENIRSEISSLRIKKKEKESEWTSYEVDQ